MTKKHRFEVSPIHNTSNEKAVYEPPRQLLQYGGACAACLSAFALGNILAWTSPANPQLLQGAAGFPVSEVENSWIGSLMPIGAAISCVPTGYLTDRFGRKMTMLGLVPFFLLSWVLIIWATSVNMLYIGRFISGMVGGAVCITAPVFTAEICQKEIRGALGSYYQLLLAGGIMSTYIIGSLVNVFWLSIISALVPIIFGILFLFFPDTPVYYLTKGQPDEARKSLKFYRGQNYDVESELGELAEAADKGNNNDEPMWKAFTTKQAIKGVTMCVGMMIFQQLSGVNSIIFYTTSIFEAAGSSLDPKYATIIIGFMEVFSTWFMTLLIDRFGRIILLVSSAAVMCISTLIMGVYFNLKDNGHDVSQLGWLPLVALCAFIIMFSVGYGPIPWAVMPELLPAQIKGTASSIAGVINWVCCFIVTKFFSDFVTIFGADVTFWIFAVISAIGTVFSYKGLPETKGKTFEQIQKELGGSDYMGTSESGL